jgi:hypothetical protein
VRRPDARVITIGTSGLLVVAIVALAVVPALGSEERSAGRSSSRVGTATVERRDLVERESADGTLGYGDAHEIAVPGTSSSDGTTDPNSSGSDGSNGNRNLRADSAMVGGTTTTSTTTSTTPSSTTTTTPPATAPPQSPPVSSPAATTPPTSAPDASAGAGGGGGGGSGGSGSDGGGGGGGTGTLTWLPARGAIIQRGEPLFRIDDRPVALLIGSVPLYRTLSTGVADGPDVRVLEENLAALGVLDPAHVDDHFDGFTADAVRAWQRSLGVDDTGSVQPEDAVVEGSAVRVADLEARLGAPATGAVISVTGTSRLVTVRLDAVKQSLAKAGDTAEVTLPNGDAADAIVFAVGSVASKENDETSAHITVVLVLDDQSKGKDLDQAPVTVDFTSARTKDALTVPVRALLARSGGTYAVVVVDGSHRRTVPVQLGAFADGYVAIDGDLRAGDRVEVAE